MKKTFRFYAIFTQDEIIDEAINISFPDFPDCESCAFRQDKALEVAQKTLLCYLDGMDFPYVNNMAKKTVMEDSVIDPTLHAITVTMDVKAGKLSMINESGSVYEKISFTFYAYFTYDEGNKDAIEISFPNLPGCFSCAFNETQAIKYAQEALSLYLHGMYAKDVQEKAAHMPDLPDSVTDTTIHAITVMMNVKDGRLNGENIIEY